MQFPLEKGNKPYFKLRKRLAAEMLAAVPSATWTVPALCAAYKWPTGLAGGGVIAIVELGGGWVQSDMNSYFESIGQPVPQITDVSVDGTQNSPNPECRLRGHDPDYRSRRSTFRSPPLPTTQLPASRQPFACTGHAGHRLRGAEGGLRRLRCMHHLLGL